MDACLVEEGYMLNNKCYLITGEHLIYILTFLNSKLFTKLILPQANITGGKGEAFLNTIPLQKPPHEIENKLIELYNQRKGNPAYIDQCIDSIFCDLYKLSEKERAYIMD